MRRGLATIVLLVAAPLSACFDRSPAESSACDAPPRTSATDAYTNFGRLSFLDLSSRMASPSTSDPGGTNKDNTHVLGPRPDGGRVLLDEVGPGELTLMRMQEDWGAPWRLEVDDRPPLTVQTSDLGGDQPADAPASAFPYPLSVSPEQGQGSSVVATPIPFRERVRWSAADKNGNFYSLVRRFPAGAPMGQQLAGTRLDNTVRLLRAGARALLPPTLRMSAGSASLPAGAETLITELGQGPRQVRVLRFRVPITDLVALGDARLRIAWDGEQSPSVDAPLKYIAGNAAGVYVPTERPLVAGWPTLALREGDTFVFELLWPMPFERTARVSLLPSLPIGGLQWEAGDEPFGHQRGWWGTFHATEAAPPTRKGEDLTFLDASGSGRIVGTVLNFGEVGATLEGDLRMYLDGSTTPQVKTTGTEEWAMGGNYWREGRQTSLPLAGLPSTTQNPPGTNVDGAGLYRFLIADGVTFNSKAIVRWEHGVGNLSENAYRAVTLWYGTPAVTALLTDALNIGDEASRTKHLYSSDGALYGLRSGNEYEVSTGPVTRTGAATLQTSTFTLALDKRNRGAFLRRTLDYGIPNQRANLFIDGEPAGTWYTAGSFMGTDRDGHPRRWRQEELPLPRHLTEGRSAVRIEVRNEHTSDPPNAAWTEFDYQMHSLVPAGCPRDG